MKSKLSWISDGSCQSLFTMSQHHVTMLPQAYHQIKSVPSDQRTLSATTAQLYTRIFRCEESVTCEYLSQQQFSQSNRSFEKRPFKIVCAQRSIKIWLAAWNLSLFFRMSRNATLSNLPTFLPSLWQNICLQLVNLQFRTSLEELVFKLLSASGSQRNAGVQLAPLRARWGLRWSGRLRVFFSKGCENCPGYEFDGCDGCIL